MGGGFQKQHSRWNLADYRESRFLNGVVMNRLEFRYPLMGTERVAVPVDHARWFATLASQLTPVQIRKAFEASGASPAEMRFLHRSREPLRGDSRRARGRRTLTSRPARLTTRVA